MSYRCQWVAAWAATLGKRGRTMLGTIVGQYKITAKLGEGGIGAVYMAEHTLIGRKAAIKTLLPEYSDKKEIVERFFNEARAATSVRHPGIVEIYDFGYQPDGTAFIVMELLPGESLGTRLRRVGKLGAAEASEIIRQAASGLAAAHQENVIHRDLKPDNLFLVPDPELGERVKILDFGIAKLTADRSSSSVKTRTGAVMGTPTYMSPEQCVGAGKVDPRSDLYSLGCIFFELLCGQPPFVGEGAGAVLGAHIYQEPPLPRAIDPSIPPEVEALIMRLLAKDPQARVGSSQELVAALSAGSSLSARPRPPTHDREGHARSPSQAHWVQTGPELPHTTLSDAGAGMRAAALPHTLPPRRSRRLAIAVAALVIAGGGIGMLALSGGDGPSQSAATSASDDPSERAVSAAAAEPAKNAVKPTESDPPGDKESPAQEPAQPVKPAEISIAIDSVPAGADVYRRGEDKPVGKTPYRGTLPASDDELVFVVKKDGHADHEVKLAANEDGSAELTLAATPVVSAKKKSSAKAKASKKSDKSRPKPKRRVKAGEYVDPF